MIRKFETRDTEQVMQIWLAANLDAHDFVPKEYWINQYPFVQEQLLQAEIYVYEQEQTIRGFVGMMGDYLAGVFVEQSCRSSGIGKSLLDCVKKHHAAFSLNVYVKNQRAVKFYLREGLSIAAKGMDKDTGEADFTMTWKKK